MPIKIIVTPLHTHLFRKKFLKNQLINQNVGEDWGHGNTWALLMEIRTDMASSKSISQALVKCVYTLSLKSPISVYTFQRNTTQVFNGLYIPDVYCRIVSGSVKLGTT